MVGMSDINHSRVAVRGTHASCVGRPGGGLSL